MQGCKILSTFYGRDEITYNSKCQFERINMIQVNIVIEMKREIMWLRWCNNYLPSSINKGCLITYIIIVFGSNSHSNKVWDSLNLDKQCRRIVLHNYLIFWYHVLLCISHIHATEFYYVYVDIKKKATCVSKPLEWVVKCTIHVHVVASRYYREISGQHGLQLYVIMDLWHNILYLC